MEFMDMVNTDMDTLAMDTKGMGTMETQNMLMAMKDMDATATTDIMGTTRTHTMGMAGSDTSEAFTLMGTALTNTYHL